MNHIKVYPDCPVCGSEMEKKSEIHKPTGSYIHFWICPKCKAKSPKCVNPETAYKVAIEWSK